MADVATPLATRPARSKRDVVLQALLITALVLTAAKPFLPEFLVRLPEAWIPPFAVWLDAFF